MVRIESPLGNRGVDLGPQMKTFDVPNDELVDVPEERQVHQPEVVNPSVSSSELAEKVRKAHQDKRESLDKINPMAKKRIEILTNLGRITKDVEIDGVIFSIKTLKAAEMKEATCASTKKATTLAEQAFESRAEQIARSVYAIDHQDIFMVLGVETYDEVCILLQDMDEQIFTKLYDEYTKLTDVVKKKYNSIEEETKGVIEDIKK
jgi:hypothetical protein